MAACSRRKSSKSDALAISWSEPGDKTLLGHFHDQCSTRPSAKERLQPWLCRSDGMSIQCGPADLSPASPGVWTKNTPSSMVFSCSSRKTNTLAGWRISQALLLTFGSHELLLPFM